MATKWKALTPEVKKLVVSVKNYFDHHKKKKNVSTSSTQRTADAMDIGVATVKRLMADYNRDPNSLERPLSDRGRKSYAIDTYNSMKKAIYLSL